MNTCRHDMTQVGGRIPRRHGWFGCIASSASHQWIWVGWIGVRMQCSEDGFILHSPEVGTLPVFFVFDVALAVFSSCHLRGLDLGPVCYLKQMQCANGE